MTTTECVTCGEEIQTDREPETGEILDCDFCGTELEVLDTDPLEVQEAPELEEDWGE